MKASRGVPRLHVVEVGDGDDPPGEDRPVVKIIAGRRSVAIDQAEEHLLARDADLYQRGDFVVRVAPQGIDVDHETQASVLRIIPVSPQHMRERFTRAVDLRRFEKRSRKWLSADCPADFAEAYLQRIGEWKLPRLRAVTGAPSLRFDGSIIDRPGYDSRTGIYYDPRGVRFPAVDQAPDRTAAGRALNSIAELFGTFDFVDEASRSVALSGILTALFRGAMQAAPLHGVSAPVAGSGKSKIVNIASILATGHHVPVNSPGKDEAETEKRIAAKLQAGDRMVSIDNVTHPLGGELLCQSLTEPLVETRVLGTSKMLVTPNVVSWYATGNNLKFAGDMVRRALRCLLDPRCEQPELREFETPDPIILAALHRPELVCAALTVARGFVVAGFPRSEAPLGSFPDWSKWVRDPLIWLGWPDPVSTIAGIRNEDPKLAALAAVLEQWEGVIGGEPVTTRNVVDRASAVGTSGYLKPEFRDALMLVGGSPSGDSLSPGRLGKWLGQVKGRTIGRKRIDEAGKVNGMQRWCLRSVAL